MILLLAAIGEGSPRRSLPCDRVAGMERIVAAAGGPRFIVMGERHGTVQAPHLFGTLVCTASRHRPVTVLLELASSATPAVETYLASDGSAEARQAFLRNEIWDPLYADGRNSAAMFALFETLRRLRHAGADIAVFGTQPDDVPAGDQHYYDLAMADGWARRAAERPAAVNLVLAGTAHAATRDNGDFGFLPAAAHLRPGDVLTIGPVAEGGASWSLTMSPEGRPLMGAHSQPGRPAARAGITLNRDASSGWHGTYAFAEPARPSPPARP